MWSRWCLCILVLSCAAIRVASARPLEPQAPPAASALDEEARKQILALKVQAVEAQEKKDLKKERELQQKILKLDPTDARALQRSDELTAILEKSEHDQLVATVNALDKEANEALARAWLAKAEDALIEAKRTRARAPLDRLEQALAEVRKYTRPQDPRVERLQTLVEQELADRRLRQWELWGVIGCVALGLVVALVFYVRRSGRVLEMIEGPQVGQVFVLQKDATALGALASEVDWAIEDPLRKISRRHCDVVRQGRHYFLVDCSMNGTQLNGRPLRKGQATLLKRGDQIGLGGEVTLRFR